MQTRPRYHAQGDELCLERCCKIRWPLKSKEEGMKTNTKSKLWMALESNDEKQPSAGRFLAAVHHFFRFVLLLGIFCC